MNILLVVGTNIRRRRNEIGLSQNQLAFEAGVTREFINKVESGKYNISLRVLQNVADILEVEVRDLLAK